MNKQRTSSDTSTGISTEQALVSSINNTNQSNKTNIPKIENLGEQTQNFQNDNLSEEEENKTLQNKK